MSDKKLITVCVPSGIGDISWIYSKLHCAPAEYEFALDVVNGWPHRSVNFCRLLPRVISSKYDNISYLDINYFQQINRLSSWARIAECGFGRVMLSANLHLERGLRLEDWLPDLPTDFHYELHTREDHKETATKIVAQARQLGRKVVGVSAASYRGSEAWDTWRSDRWNRFLDRLSDVGDVCFLLMGGFWDDLTAALGKRKDAIECVGKTSVGEAYEILRQLDGYVGFSSGLGVMATLLHKPTFMMWPGHQVALSTSWAPPDMLAERSYVASQWNEPFEVLELAEPWFQKFVGGR